MHTKANTQTPSTTQRSRRRRIERMIADQRKRKPLAREGRAETAGERKRSPLARGERKRRAAGERKRKPLKR